MDSDERLDEKRKRLANVLKYLREKGISQRDIVDEISKDKLQFDETQLSHIKSGKIKYIPEELLERLHSVYNINPNYIQLKSNVLLDVASEKFTHFEKFVSSWDTVKKGGQNYLHVTMDENFYNLLITVDKLKLTTDDVEILKNELEQVKEKSNLSEVLKEYVILPKDDMEEIVKEAVSERKDISEVIDFYKHEGYIVDENKTKRVIKIEE